MELQLEQILKDAQKRGASDVFIIPGKALSIKVGGSIIEVTDTPLMPPDTRDLLIEVYRHTRNRSIEQVEQEGDDDFSFSLPGVARFRVSAFKQRGSLSAVIRIVAFELPDPAKLGIPQIALDQGDRTKGLVLVTGPTGSGKSTTLACIINKINTDRNAHIITLEDPIEFLHKHKNSIVSQREIALDTDSYPVALKAALRQAPNVILIGELRDQTTIEIAMTAAETGHLVISSLHTVGSANTVDRIIDAFPPSQQGQIRLQLSMVLASVISQQLIISNDGDVVPVFEIMIVNDAIKNMIRESKIHQIDSVITQSAGEGMVSMDAELLRLAKEEIISKQTAVAFATMPELMKKRLLQV